jgi:hypothetical protein
VAEGNQHAGEIKVQHVGAAVRVGECVYIKKSKVMMLLYLKLFEI